MSEFPLWSELIRQALPSQDAPKTGEKLSVKESREVAPSLKKQDGYAVVAIENNKVHPNSMAWDLNATEVVLYANMLRTKHPQATISIEAKGGRISQVLKPGELFKEAHAVELKPGTRVKTPHGRGKIVRYDKGDGPHGSPYYIVDVGKQASEKVMAHQLQREAAEPQPEFSFGNQKASGWPPGLKIAAIKSYREKEKNNDHTGNALFVTRMFGKPQEIAIVQKLWDIRAKEGIDANKHQSLMSAVEMLHSKYYRQLMSLKEDKKPYVWECMDCGNIWRSTQSGNTRNVRCPKCHSDDVLPGKFISDRAGYTAKNEATTPGAAHAAYYKQHKITHIVAKKDLAAHKKWMDSEGYGTHTVPLPVNDRNAKTHVGVVSKGYVESTYHEDGFAGPIKEGYLKEDSDSDYQEYFKKMLQKHNYDSPADIPDDKKDDFFNAVDTGYSAKNEDSDSDYQEYFKKVYETTQRPIHVGDYVHAGFAVKNGVGYSGRIDKIDGNWVYVNIGKDKSVRFTNDPMSNWGERIIKAPIKNVSLQEENENSDSDYQEYFKKMLQKHGYDSPADIPDDKKDDFFNAVDTGYSAKNEEVDPNATDEHESDDQDMMSAQVDSLADKSAELHDILNQLKLADVPAWIQSKVSTADTDINSILDYMKYEEKHPVAEDVSDNQGMDRARSMARGAAAAPFQQRLPTMKEPVVPMRMQAAMVVAKALGSVRGTGQSADFKVSSSSPEALVNQALRVWLSGSHTNEGWALGAKMLKLAKEMGIKWDEKLVRSKLAPITLKKLGLDEAESAPVVGVSNAEKLAHRQGAEKETLALRHNKEKTSQAQRDGEEKIRKQAAASTQTKTSK